MGLSGKTTEEKIWNFLIGKGLNEHGAAGLMGNLYAESGLSPINMQNSYEKKLGYTDETYTQSVDNGDYTNFIKDSAGYGLAQWTFWSRKQNLINFVRSRGKSIGDLESQLEFLYKELSDGYKSVLTALKSSKTVLEASTAVLTGYEKPAGQGLTVKAKRASYGQKYYNKYAVKNGGQIMTESQVRAKVVNAFLAWKGCKESNGSHRKIIDIYNGHAPLARGYRVQYGDSWCATAASAAAIVAGLTDIIPTECGCGQMIQLFKNMGRWQENDAYTPKAGDYIFYDWDDNGAGDDTGWPEHVGVVVSVSGSTITVIEGNKNDAVGERQIAVNARYIRGYGVPNYASKATSTPASGSKSVSELANEVIQGKWGSGEDRKNRLEAAGYNYSEVQSAVNAKLSGSSTPKKSITEVAREVIAGKWGNGADRKKKLEAAGYNYSEVQKKVNELL